MIFKDLVRDFICDQLPSIETRCCPDQYVGKIVTFSDSIPDFSIRESVCYRSQDEKCVILVLESPHIEEFSNSPCPAKGKTGERIRKWFVDVNGLSQYSDYGLIIVNAIQYQCSLGMPTKLFRDDVFIRFWKQGGQESFITRLKNCSKSGDVILNCCTKGYDEKNKLRDLVQSSILENQVIGCKVLRRTHPSSWYSEKNRKFEV